MLATRVGRRDALAAVLGVAGLGAVTELAAGKGNNHRNRKQHRRKRRRRNRVGDQPDCAGVLTRAGCSRVHDTALQRDKWVCPKGTNLQDTNLSGCRLEHSEMPGVQLQRAFLNRAVLNDADFRAGNFERATMDGTSSVNTRYDDASMWSASMGQADLRGANFQNADIRFRDWLLTTCPDSVPISRGRKDCCANLNGHTAKYCGTP